MHSFEYVPSSVKPIDSPSLTGSTNLVVGGVLASALATEAGRESIGHVVRSASEYLVRNPALTVGILVIGGLGYLAHKAMITSSRIEVAGVLTVEPGKR